MTNMKQTNMRVPNTVKAWTLLLWSVFFALCLTGCDKFRPSAADSAPEGKTFTILAGSELKDVAEMVTNWGKREGVNIRFEYTGTLDAIDRLADKSAYDAVWVSHGKYLQLVPAVKSQIKASEKTMYSRVVLGVKPEVAKALGWESGKTGWADVMQAVKQHKFRFAMTNPTGSNTGFVALIGLAAELSGKGDALQEGDIPSDQLSEFFAGQSMSAGSSGALADMFVANPARVDGIINYESVIRSMASKGQNLQVITPREGVITADYPLMLLARSKQADIYQKLVTWLRTDATQKQIASTTFRTPLTGAGNQDVVNELPFPASLSVVDAVLKGFLNRYSVPASSFFVLDVSGSMEGERINNLKQAMLSLAEGDQSTSGRFSLFRNREHIEILPFCDVQLPGHAYDLTEDSVHNKQTLRDMGTDINQLQADGGTAIYGSIAQIYPKAQAILKQGKRRVSIVLMTDGENTNGMNLDTFRQFIRQQGEPRVPVFGVLYGEARQSDMAELANLTGGRVFDARSINLPRIMKDIRTFQ